MFCNFKKATIILILSFLFCSCSALGSRTQENTGIYITPDDIESISEKLDKKEIIYTQGIDDNFPLYYWSENGSVFHSYAECSYLQNSDVIICGNINHAYNGNVKTTCSKCFEKND